MHKSLASASLFAFAAADSQLFAPAPMYQPAMTYGQMQTVDAYAPAMVPAEALMYAQPVEAAYPEDSEGSALYYATGALLVGAAAVVASRGQQKTVAEPDLEAATDAARVAILFSSGRSSGKKAPARGGKKAPAKRAPAKRAPARAQAAPDDDLFVHEGTRGFQGDSFAFVYRQGLAQ